MKNRKQTKRILSAQKNLFRAVRIFRVLSHEMPTVNGSLRRPLSNWKMTRRIVRPHAETFTHTHPHVGPFDSIAKPFHFIPSHPIPAQLIPSCHHTICFGFLCWRIWPGSRQQAAGGRQRASSSRRSSSSVSWGTYAACQSNLLTWLWFCSRTSRDQDLHGEKPHNNIPYPSQVSFIYQTKME